MAGVKCRISYRTLFKRLQILLLPCEYIFLLIIFIANNQTNNTVHSVNTRNKLQQHKPTANISCFQKCAFYAAIKIFNSLPSSLTNPMNKKTQFKVAIKSYLKTHSFHSVDKFLMLENDSCFFLILYYMGSLIYMLYICGFICNNLVLYMNLLITLC
jgi:hypothetical protein